MSDAQILALEVFFIGLLVLSVIVIGWISFVVLSRLFKGQR
ncbi:hypothetical protein [Nesterenkonia natronophila]|jgi:hypothetical protein|nr:hypothetical protein [Nesterenkonia natronophila]